MTDNDCDWSKVNVYNLDYRSKEVHLECPEGSYIANIKNLGFLYLYDKRINGNSTGESFCYALENLDAKPKSFNDSDYVSEEEEGRRRRLWGDSIEFWEEPLSEIPEELREFVTLSGDIPLTDDVVEVEEPQRWL